MKNRTAIITGVSRLQGIGRAVCLELAKRNIDIVFTYWTEYDRQMPWSIEAHEPTAIQQEILAQGVRCVKLELDLAAESSVNELFDFAERSFGPVSILVNNATHSTESSVDTVSATDLDQHYRINTRATTLLTVEFIRRFVGQQGGRIINLSSGQSLGPMSSELAYALTKTSAEMLTYTLATEIASRGITINAVNPGPTDTGWISDSLALDLKKRFPLKRLGLPEDAARLIGFLASEEAEWLTGQVIHSEGGFRR